jgi:excisionase family DNA binding protein
LLHTQEVTGSNPVRPTSVNERVGRISDPFIFYMVATWLKHLIIPKKFRCTNLIISKWKKHFYFSILKSLVCDCIKEELSKFLELNQGHKDDDKLMNRKELADFLHISLVTILKYQKNGTLPYYRIGGRLLFKKGEVLKAIEPLRRFSRRY